MKPTYFVKCAAIVVSLLLSPVAFAQQTTQDVKIHNAERIDSQRPTIDGRLDDACWQNGEWAGDFVQWQPHENGKPSQQTEFKVLYDDKYVYCAIRAYDTEPDKISRIMSRRDQYAGDGAGIIFDSFHDHRTAYEFAMTAAGTKVDLSHLDDGGEWQWDQSWNAVWHGKTALEDSAWTAEMRVPLSQLRFNEKDEHVWGVHVWRGIYRLSEEDHWKYIPRNALGGVRYFGELHGITGIGTPKRIELQPYTRGSLESFKKIPGNPFAKGHREHAAIGLDGKIGIKNNYTLDFTINPDFGQVEADPSVVNLTAYETFYSEKRPFFMEGAQSIMNFQIGNDQLYYSRRLGRRPSYEPDLEDGEYAKTPESSTILGAFKLTGKNNRGLSFGIQEGMTALERADVRSNGQTQQEDVEPFTNYLVARAQQELRGGETVMGGIFTATNRHISADHLKFMHQAAYSGGMDLSHQWAEKTWYLKSSAAFSQVQGDQQAITRTQKSSRHYYQRPDANHVALDTSRTSLSGHGGSMEIGRGGEGSWRLSGGMDWLSPGFELNDIGFLRTTDVIRQTAEVEYESQKPAGIFRSYSASIEQYNHWNFNRERLQSGLELGAHLQFVNQYGGGVHFHRETGIRDPRVLRGGPTFRFANNWAAFWHVNTDRRRLISGMLFNRNEWSDDNQLHSMTIEPRVTFRFSDMFNLSTSFEYRTNRNNLQYVKTRSFNDTSRYILGRIKQKTYSQTIRLNYFLTPDFSIEYYGQPFVSTGSYSAFKRVTNPLDRTPDERYARFTSDEIHYDETDNEYTIDEDRDTNTDYVFGNPDFNILEFRSNLVIRWEYKPGSTVFLVWSQTRDDRFDDRQFTFRDNLQDIFSVPSHNVFLVKFNYWFSL